MSTVIWRGALRLGLLEVPVSLHPGEEPETPDFTLLDRRDRSPIGIRRVNKKTGLEVPAHEIVRGVKTGPDEHVVVTDEDFEAFDAGRTRLIEILSFVNRDEIHPAYFDRPYYLEPAEGGVKGYALLRDLLGRFRKAAVARVVIKTRGTLAAILAQNSLLVLNVLRYAHELRDPSELALPEEDLGKLGVSDLEVKLAERLAEEMTGPWNPEAHRDEFREDLIRFVRHKAAMERARAGERPAAGVPERTAEAGGDLLGVLRSSLERTVRRKTFLRPEPPRDTG